jgi:hypothetical protein
VEISTFVRLRKTLTSFDPALVSNLHRTVRKEAIR